MTTLQYFLNHGVNFLTVPQDGPGLDTDYPAERMATLAANSEAMPKLLFDVPGFYNPTRNTMALARRKRFVELVTAHGFILIKYDPCRWLCFEGDSVPPKKSLDTEGVVIAIGTVLEILSPGRRTGWAVADVGIVRHKAIAKSGWRLVASYRDSLSMAYGPTR